MPVNDWIERKYRQDSKMILENHQAEIIWNRARNGEKKEHVIMQTLQLPQIVTMAGPLGKEDTDPRTEELGAWL